VPEAAERITPEQKRTALDLALRSRSLARSEQIRHLLRFLGEKEIAGHATDLTEYQIGVEGLGLPKGYSPSDDSTVRNRAFTLRKKVEELYRDELSGERIRIEFQRGSYAPRFIEVSEPEALPETEPPPAQSWRTLVGFALGALTVFGGLAVWSSLRVEGPVDAIVREAWGPILDAKAEALVLVTTSPQMPVRALPGQWKPQAGEPVLEAPPEVVRWYETLRPVPEGQKVFLLPTHNSAGLGDALAATAATRMLAAAGASFQVAPEKVVPLAAMRKRNLVLLGGSSDAASVRHFLEQGRFHLRFNAESGDWSFYEQGGQNRVFAPKRDAGNLLAETYGMVTVLPSEGGEGRQRTVVIASTYTAGNQAAMEYFTSPKSLRELKAKLGGKFPEAYQVVVRTSVNQMLPLNFRYEAHAVLE
jgi:hypothetical protein